MKQCENCLCLDQLGCCGPLVVGEKSQTQHNCVAYPDGIPAAYWLEKELCPHYMGTQRETICAPPLPM